MENPQTNSMVLNDITPEEIINKTSCGNDKINMSLVKNVINCIVLPLTHVCKLSLAQGIFPDNMKTARVLPLYKAGYRQDFSNYRPVSVLPQFSKIP